MEEVIAIILSELLKAGIKYTIEKKVDEVGNNITRLVQLFDDDADGVIDREEVIYTIESLIPDLSSDYCIVDRDDEIGLGVPRLHLIDNIDMSDMLDEMITGNDNGVIIDDETYVPLPYDATGDGVPDWGKLVDLDDNGIPDAAPDAPFYPVGSDGYNRIVERMNTGGSGVDIVLVSSDGDIAIYDRNGNIKSEDVDAAYATWVSENNIMSKSLDNYSVTEGLLFLMFVVLLFSFFGNIFRKRRVM